MIKAHRRIVSAALLFCIFLVLIIIFILSACAFDVRLAQSGYLNLIAAAVGGSAAFFVPYWISLYIFKLRMFAGLSAIKSLYLSILLKLGQVLLSTLLLIFCFIQTGPAAVLVILSFIFSLVFNQLVVFFMQKSAK